jgi:titin
VIAYSASQNDIVGNQISGNTDAGVLLSHGATGNTVEENAIGLNATGSGSLANQQDGVDLLSSGNSVRGNVISGNAGSGLVVEGSDNVIQANWIGTNESGTGAVSNQIDGVLMVGVKGSGGNTVGGTAVTAGNLISGNTRYGIDVGGLASSGNLIEGNTIGTAVGGKSALPNGLDGVRINDTTGYTIGGAAAGAGNLISGNQGDGVRLTGPQSSGIAVLGNRIGTDVTGLLPVLNQGNGVHLVDRANHNTVGGTTPGAGNLISANVGDGVRIEGILDASAVVPGTDHNLVLGNLIGTNRVGVAGLGNLGDGVHVLDGARSNQIGGPGGVQPGGQGNLIPGNLQDGVAIVGRGANFNVVAGDLIGTSITGHAPLGNGAHGVFVAGGAQENSIGGTTAGARDIISGNAGNGVYITDPGTTDNVVTGDFIGIAANGTGSLGNCGDGDVLNGVTANSITSSVICFNGAYSIEGFSGSNATNNTITGDTFIVKIGKTTYGNKLGATFYQ